MILMFYFIINNKFILSYLYIIKKYVYWLKEWFNIDLNFEMVSFEKSSTVMQKNAIRIGRVIYISISKNGMVRTMRPLFDRTHLKVLRINSIGVQLFIDICPLSFK